LGESTELKCSTGLLMHEFVDFDKYINIMIMQTLKKRKLYFFLVFCITIFPKEAQNKIKQSRDRDDLFINDENT